jgi:uncharacterized RDD family membrane protein YckC
MQRASNERPMDRNIDVRTPESIAFRYDLAGLGSRFLAVFVDLMIQIVLVLLLFWGLETLASHAPRGATHTGAVEHFAESAAIGLMIFVVFMIFYGYFMLFEAFWHGQTPGKKLLGIRVVRDGGYPLDFGGSVVRNLVRMMEQLLGFYIVAAVSAVLSPENKRVGDYAAGTIVVRESRVDAPLTLSQALAASSAQRASSAYLSDDERNVISSYLARRRGMDKRRRGDLAAQIASRVRSRAPVDLRDLPDDELLERM